MSPFLSSVGSKLAERWVGVLLVPGALLVAATGCAALLGHRHALDAGLLVRELTAIARSHRDGASVVLTSVAGLLAAAAAAVAARGLGRVVETAWIGPWRGPAALLARPLVAARRRRAAKAAQRAGVHPVPAYLPQLPTWIGEQFRLLDARIAAQYHDLRLALVLPRLWVLLPEPARAPVQLATSQFHGAAVLTGWGLLYLALGALWFPAAGVGIAVILTGWRRARSHAAALTTLVEATVDTHLVAVTTALNLTMPATGFTADLAAHLNDQFHKGA